MQTLTLIKKDNSSKDTDDDLPSKTESTEHIIIKDIQSDELNEEEMKENLTKFIFFHLSMILVSFYLGKSTSIKGSDFSITESDALL